MKQVSRFDVVVAALVASAMWLPTLSIWFEPPEREERAQQLAAHHMDVWSTERGPDVTPRAMNPEWELMTRLYTVIGLADRALVADAGERKRALGAIDRIVERTLEDLRANGSHHFLLGYARNEPFHFEPDRSLFVDGEVTMMLAARQLVAPEPRQRRVLARYAARVSEQMEAGPILSGESYPDECWTFCNTTALAALILADASLGSDHEALAKRWVASAKEHLIDARTGLLASSYTYAGEVRQGPEGSTLWMTVHNLRLLDDELAHAQYQRARDALALRVLGFGFAREWVGVGSSDIDSGPIIPILGASPAASGLAVLAAASFGDNVYFEALSRSLDLAAQPIERRGRLRFAAAGPMGDAVVFAAHTVGPLWRRARRVGGNDD